MFLFRTSDIFQGNRSSEQSSPSDVRKKNLGRKGITPFKSIRPIGITNCTASPAGSSRSVCEKSLISLFGPVACPGTFRGLSCANEERKHRSHPLTTNTYYRTTKKNLSRDSMNLISIGFFFYLHLKTMLRSDWHCNSYVDGRTCKQKIQGALFFCSAMNQQLVLPGFL